MTGLLFFYVCLEISLTIVSLCVGFGVGSPKLASQVPVDKPVGLLCIRIDKKSTVCSLKFERRDVLIGRVLDVADRIGNTKRKQPQAQRTIHTGATKCLAVMGGIFENVLKANISPHYINA